MKLLENHFWQRFLELVTHPATGRTPNYLRWKKSFLFLARRENRPRWAEKTAPPPPTDSTTGPDLTWQASMTPSPVTYFIKCLIWCSLKWSFIRSVGSHSHSQAANNKHILNVQTGSSDLKENIAIPPRGDGVYILKRFIFLAPTPSVFGA